MAFSRETWRWVAGLTVVLLAFVVCLSWIRQHQARKIVLSTTSAVFPADGREYVVLRVARRDGGRMEAGDISVEAVADREKADGGGDHRVVQAGKELVVWMRAPVRAAERGVRVRWWRYSSIRVVRFTPSDVDSFGDGMPDALRLHSIEDRAAFREWFWRLAEMQAELPETEKAAEIQDCAGLLRYAYREALKAHSAEWAEEQHAGDVAFGSVQQWRYPDTMLGAGLFRVRPGPFVEGDENNGAFAQFADARALMTWNTFRVVGGLRAAKPGDLFFFRQFGQNSPYHSMVITGRDAGWVVYHTGPIGRGKGEIRRMAVTDLLRHPDTRWRPIAENSNFLGVFRWNVLREGD